MGWWSSNENLGDGNSFGQSVKNALTPNDGQSYIGGNLVNSEGDAWGDGIDYRTYHGEPYDILTMAMMIRALPVALYQPQPLQPLLLSPTLPH